MDLVLMMVSPLRSRPGNTTRFGYDPDGNLTTTTFPNGVVGTGSYDAADLLTSLTDSGPGGAIPAGAAAVGAEPVAGALLEGSEAVGYVNVAATCADALTSARGAVTATDCAASVLVSVGTAGFERLVAPGLTRNGKQVFDQVELTARGAINSFGDLLGSERGWKTGDSSICPGPPVQPEIRPAP